MNERERSPIPDGVWIQCGECGEAIFAREFERAGKVCPHCGQHDALNAAERAAYVLDEFDEESDADGRPSGPFHTVGEIAGFPAAVAVIDAESAGVSSGGLFRSVAELAGLSKPLIVFAANGTGAGEESAEPRLRLTRALKRLGEERLPYILVVTDGSEEDGYRAFLPPGDIVLAETGKRKEAENPLESAHPHIDSFLTRHELNETLPKLLAFFRQRGSEDGARPN